MNIVRSSAIAAIVLIHTLSSVAQVKITRAEYINRYKSLAVEFQEIYGIPASIKMAQALLESDNGNSPLAVNGNNHFGIKCKKEWTGETILHDDDAKGECFRKYACVEDSYRDHCEFLDKSPRYQKLFTLDPTDYKGWAYGLKEAGYATNPKYPEMLIKIIEDNQLHLLDMGFNMEVLEPAVSITPVLSQENVVFKSGGGGNVDIDNYIVAAQNVKGYAIYNNNGSQFITAREGDTFQSIAAIFGTTDKRLLKYNDLPAGSQVVSGEMVYIKAKARRSSNGKVLHVVKDGDTMHSISQQYGIKLSRLASINGRGQDAKLLEGQQLRLM